MLTHQNSNTVNLKQIVNNLNQSNIIRNCLKVKKQFMTYIQSPNAY